MPSPPLCPSCALQGTRRWEARLLNNRGLLHAYRGSLRDAEADLRVALALHESAGASLSAADSWWNLGFVAARRGDAPTALQHFDAAAEIYRRHGLPVQELMLDRVELLLGVGAVGEARRTARRAGREPGGRCPRPAPAGGAPPAGTGDHRGRPAGRGQPGRRRGRAALHGAGPIGLGGPGQVRRGAAPTSAPGTTRPACCASRWPSPSRSASAGGGCTSSTSGSLPPSWP